MVSARPSARLLRQHNSLCSFLCRSSLPGGRKLVALLILLNVVVSSGGVAGVAVGREDAGSGGGEEGGMRKGAVGSEEGGMMSDGRAASTVDDPSISSILSVNHVDAGTPPMEAKVVHKRSARANLRRALSRGQRLYWPQSPGSAGQSLLVQRIRPLAGLPAVPARGSRDPSPVYILQLPQQQAARASGQGSNGGQRGRERLPAQSSRDNRPIDEIIQAAYDNYGTNTVSRVMAAVSGQGLFLEELDMVLTPEQYSLLQPLYGGRVKRKAVRRSQWLWPGGVIPYEFSPRFDNRDRGMVQDAMRFLEGCTCVRFRPATQQDRDRVVFGSDSAGCFSMMGKFGGPQPINLGSGCMRSDIIVHELLHAVGFAHEHQRPDRDRFVTIIERNVRMDRLDQFRKFRRADISTRVGYDYRSIMHYGKRAFADQQARGNTVVTRDPSAQEVIGTVRTPSEKDITTVNLLYTCAQPTTTVKPEPITMKPHPAKPHPVMPPRPTNPRVVGEGASENNNRDGAFDLNLISAINDAVGHVHDMGGQQPMRAHGVLGATPIEITGNRLPRRFNEPLLVDTQPRVIRQPRVRILQQPTRPGNYWEQPALIRTL